MARTPIAQSLETIAAEAAAERGLTRRDLLQNAGALGVAAAGATTIGRLIAAAEGAAAPRTVVVGAGLAGLTAAYRLKQAGINAQVHEASDRSAAAVGRSAASSQRARSPSTAAS
jgi:NADPH-dependent 2,4-dienoyl-CoA reductase/sulfur reductase-like enzyme